MEETEEKRKQEMEETIEMFFQPAADIVPLRRKQSLADSDDNDAGDDYDNDAGNSDDKDDGDSDNDNRVKRKSYQWIQTPSFSSFQPDSPAPAPPSPRSHASSADKTRSAKYHQPQNIGPSYKQRTQGGSFQYFRPIPTSTTTTTAATPATSASNNIVFPTELSSAQALKPSPVPIFYAVPPSPTPSPTPMSYDNQPMSNFIFP